MNDNVLTIVLAVIGSGIFSTILNRIFTKHDEKKSENAEIKKALRLMMKNQLRDLCIKYIDQQWIYADELEDLIAMHECYHDDLNGNGYLNKLMDSVKSLEIRGIGVK